MVVGFRPPSVWGKTGVGDGVAVGVGVAVVVGVGVEVGVGVGVGVEVWPSLPGAGVRVGVGVLVGVAVAVAAFGVRSPATVEVGGIPASLPGTGVGWEASWAARTSFCWPSKTSTPAPAPWSWLSNWGSRDESD